MPQDNNPPATDPGAYLGRCRCPACHAPLIAAAEQVNCAQCGAAYPISFGRPVLLRADNALFDIAAYDQPPSHVPAGLARRLIPDPSVNLASRRIIAKLVEILPQQSMILVVGGGRQRGWLDPMLAKGRHKALYSDIDVRAAIDLFADGHDLPFNDASFDAVITTAVLEHVIYPERVAAEIARVVRPGGLLYSELPFMQQVHEGAYDFTRYTMSGHRRLFNDFKAIDAGMVAGPGTVLAWSLENIIVAFCRGKRMRTIGKASARIAFAWFKYLDYALRNSPAALDGASCTYLFGERISSRISDREIVETYVGGQNLRHT